MSYRGRFAPSPTGPLHFGSLVAAVGSHVRARAQNGVWLVRMEDLDPPREVAGAAKDILATLAAFGMLSDEPVIFQSRRDDAYAAALAGLHLKDLVFPCWCSRSDLEVNHGLHQGDCIAAPDRSRAPAWRVRAEDRTIGFLDLLQGAQTQNIGSEVGDFVVRRVEGWTAYQLAVVVDDAESRVTEIVRGSDLLDSTPRQIYLQQLLGLPTPDYCHLPLVLDARGQKLSKSDHARPVDRDDPIPALCAALRFLGLDAGIRGATANPESLLANAAQHFELLKLRRDSTRTSATESRV